MGRVASERSPYAALDTFVVGPDKIAESQNGGDLEELAIRHRQVTFSRLA